LYSIPIEDLNIPSNDILRIGDNMESDIKQAQKLGIDSFYIPKAIEILFDTDPRTERFYGKYRKDIGASILLGLLASHI